MEGWLSMAEACFDLEYNGQMVLGKGPEAGQGDGWLVWSVLSPFRPSASPSGSGSPRAASYDGFLAVLGHYLIYHLRLGFAGVLLYAPPSLMRRLERDEGRLDEWVMEGRLVPIAWDRFGRHQQNVVPRQASGSNACGIVS